MFDNLYDTLQQLNFWSTILLGAFALIFIIRLILAILLRVRLLFIKNKNEVFNNEAISILLPFRNEEEHLKNNLPKILENREIEIIAVDDFSQDNSYINIGHYKSNDDRIKLTSLNQETNHSEKLSRNIALKAANFDWVILISPSTETFHPDWIQNIKKAIDSSKNVVINYSNIQKSKGLYNRLYRLEILHQFILSSGSTINGVAYIYNEDNIAFLKDEYFKKNGFKGFMDEHYAHLELVINQFIKNKTSALNFNDSSAVKKNISIKRENYRELLIKRKRVEKNLPSRKRIFIYGNYATQYLHLLSIITLLFILPELYPLVLLDLIILIIINTITVNLLVRRLGERNLFLSSLLYGLTQPYIKLFFKRNVKSRKKRNGRSTISSL